MLADLRDSALPREIPTRVESGVALKSVTLDYPTRPPLRALEDVTLEILAGRFVSLIGPSGCGKSTLLRLVAGVLEPTAGTISIGGATPAEAQALHRFGFVFQDPVLLPWRDLRGNVELLLEITGCERDERRARARALLDLVGLADFEHLQPAQLSGGMRQRASIARALALDPPVLLMDEPFSAVDEFQREALNDELLRIWERQQSSVLFVTHNIEEAIYLSDSIVIMATNPGRIVQYVEVDLPRPRDPGIRSEPEFLALRRFLREILVR